MTRKWGCCWPRANGFNGRIQGNEKSRASNHSPSDFRSSIFLQANQYLQSPVRCPPVPGPWSPVRLFHAVSGRQPPPVWPRPLRPGPTHDSFSVPSSSTEPPRLSPGTRLCRPGSLWLSRSFPSTSVYKTATHAGLPSLLSPNLSTIRPLRSAISSTTSQLSTAAIVFPHTTTPFPRLPSLPQPRKLPPSPIRLPTLSKNYNL